LTAGLFVVCNPTAGRGRAGRLLDPLLQTLRRRGPVEAGVSAGPGDEARLAREAAGRGFRRVVALGGDGTWSNVANALIASGRDVELALIPGGTGSDLAKSLGVPAGDLEGAAAIAAGDRVRSIDVGRIGERRFANIAGFGYDVAVLEHSRTVPILKGSAVYIYSALRQLVSFRGFSVDMEVDGGGWQRRELLMLIVANARIFGGSFRIAPDALLDDGLLDAVCFGNVSTAGRFRLMIRLLRGTHLRADAVEHLRVRTLGLRFPSPPRYEVDGEWTQGETAEVAVSVEPGRLRVLAGE
jgi:diacylglycerol kinase (ATP)